MFANSKPKLSKLNSDFCKILLFSNILLYKLKKKINFNNFLKTYAKRSTWQIDTMKIFCKQLLESDNG